MKASFFLLFTLIFVSIESISFAQVRRCGTQGPDQAKLQRLNFELARFDNLRKQKALSQGLDANSIFRSTGSVTVPVWFHVINKGSGIANGDISISAIDEQIKVLNDSFSGSTGGSPTPFNFVLAGVDRTTNSNWYTMGYGSTAERDAKAALRKGGA